MRREHAPKDRFRPVRVAHPEVQPAHPDPSADILGILRDQSLEPRERPGVRARAREALRFGPLIRCGLSGQQAGQDQDGHHRHYLMKSISL